MERCHSCGATVLVELEASYDGDETVIDRIIGGVQCDGCKEIFCNACAQSTNCRECEAVPA